MLTNPTIDMLRELGLSGMASAYHELEAQPEVRSLEHGEWLALLLEREATTRRQKRFEARARAARLRHDAQVENIDFRAARGLDRRDRAGHLRRVGHVGGGEDRLMPRVAQALRHRLALACRQVHDADPRALGREAFRCGQPAAASPAGDKGGLALQTSCHVILPCRACAPGRFPV